jgi:glycosyltransferase involved in cell wall biosynthesis
VGYFSKPKLLLLKNAERFLGLFTHKMVAMGTKVRDDLVAAGIAPGSKFEVFFPGVDFPINISRANAIANLGLSSSKIYCTFVGRLTQIKRPDRLIEIAKEVKRANSEVIFLVVGDGDLANRTKAEAKNLDLPMIFLGWQANVSEILAASDLAILVSDNEAVALSLIEAGHAGIPVVTTPAGSVGDVVVNDFNGYVTTFNAREIADAVLRLANDPKLRRQMGENGKIRSAKLFSVARMVADHENLYKRLLRK